MKKKMAKPLTHQLTERSAELHLPWCQLHPAQTKNFFKRGWVLVVDDRTPKTRIIATVPLDVLVATNFPWGDPL